MSDFAATYAVYVSPIAVELHNDQQPGLAQGRCVCKQANYLSILRFARNLALHQHLPLRNYAKQS